MPPSQSATFSMVFVTIPSTLIFVRVMLGLLEMEKRVLVSGGVSLETNVAEQCI